ncbi:MAG: PAS domain S-box protein [Ignavibacteriales bacterium]|nr:PAS domain S-box protein [Ignavibacteriales bacterium]
MEYTQLSKEELLEKVYELENQVEVLRGALPGPEAAKAPVFGADAFGDIFNQLLGSDMSNLYGDYVVSMINNMTVPAYFADIEATVLGCNKFFEALIGMSSNEVKQRQLGEIMPEYAPEGDQPPVDESEENAEMINYEAIITDSNGNKKEVVISKSIVKNLDGSIAGVIGVINDITEKRTAERALVESERKLREANATKDRFFSIISHDLRSPFAAILGFTDTLIDLYPELTDEEKFSFIKDVSDSAKKAFRLVENLLAWARTQRGELTITPKPVHLYPIVKELVDLYTPLAKQRNMDVLCDIPKDTYLLADEQTITLVIRNLINNSAKFNKDDEAIIISAREDDGSVIVFIRDHGIGIKPEDIGKLFNLDTNSKVGNSPQKGSGLGLILCKQFVEQNGGTIAVNSEYGKFTEFTIVLPSASQMVKDSAAV